MSLNFDNRVSPSNRAADSGVDLNATQPDSADATAAPSLHTASPLQTYHPQLARLQTTAQSGPDFDAQVRGTDAKPIDLTLAKLDQDVYHLPESGAPPKRIDGYTRLSDDQLRAANIDPSALDTPSTGFRAAIYRNAQGDTVLAFGGSKDWSPDYTKNNIPQGLGLDAPQFDQAVALATQAKAAFGNSLVISGHSLGGGLASAASIATDTAAVTFNASGLHDNTIRRIVPDADVAALKQEADDGLIRRYAVNGEALTGEQETGALRGAMPDAIGHKIELNDPDPQPWYDELPGVNLITDTIHGGKLHGIDSVLSALRKDQPWNGSAGNKDSVVDTISDAIGHGANAVANGVDWLKNEGKSAIGAAADKLADGADHVPVIGGALSATVHGVGSVAKGAVEVGGDVLEGTIEVTGHVLQGVDKTVGNAVGGVVDGAKKVGGFVADGAKAVGHTLSKALPWNW